MPKHLVHLVWLLFFVLSCNGADDDDSAVGDDDTGIPADDDTGDDDTVVPDDDSSDDDTEPTALRGACDLADKVGWFVVQHEVEYTVVSGEVRDSVVPSTVLENVLEQGDCRLLRSNNPFCDPPCAWDETCDFDGECIPYPANLDVGTVTITGLNKEVSMEPPGGGLPASYFDTEMPHPGFDPGAAIQLDASGNDTASFTLYGEGLAPLEAPDEAWIVREDEPLEVSWTPSQGEQVHVLLRLNIDQHGTSPVEVWCEVADTGTTNVPADVMNALLGYGVSGFATGNIYRRTVDSVQVDVGCVEFQVYSHLAADLQVDGHIPCDSPDDCPEGMVCDIPTGTCVPE